MRKTYGGAANVQRGVAGFMLKKLLFVYLQYLVLSVTSLKNFNLFLRLLYLVQEGVYKTRTRNYTIKKAEKEQDAKSR